MFNKVSKILVSLLMTVMLLLPQNVFGFHNMASSQVLANVKSGVLLQKNNPKYVHKLKSNINNKPGYAKGELIVKFKNNISQMAKSSVYHKFSLKTQKRFKVINADLVNIPSNANINDAMKKLKSEPNVDFVQPNYIYHTQSLTSDPLSNQQWGLQNTGQVIEGVQGVNGIDINVKDAWNITKGSNQVVVGVIDTGIDINHPDLKDKIWTNPGEIPNNGIDDDHDGYVDDVHGWDFLHNDNNVFSPQDGDEHGTHVVGTIAASLNTIGVVGVAPNVKIMPLKALGPDGGETSEVISALEYAEQKGVKVVNASFGGNSDDIALKEAIQNSGILFVAAAGNDGVNNDISPTYPASFDCPNILSVAAVDNRGKLADFSNYGVNSVDVAAPGVGILSTIPKRLDKGAAIYSDYYGIYKTLFQGFGNEIIASDAERDILMNNVLGLFNVAPTDRILLVQDDESDIGYMDVLKYYLKPLKDLGYTNVTTYKVMAGGFGPDFSTLSQYKFVIWFTGDATGYGTLNQMPITYNDQSNLEKYLDNGGNLYLSGRYTAMSFINDDYFSSYYLHAKLADMDSNRSTVIGKQSTIFEGQRFNLNPDLNSFLVDLAPSDGYGSVVLCYEMDQNYDNAYEYMDGTSMAAPHVTGIAALLLSEGLQDPLQIKKEILDSSKPLSSLNGKVLTGGIVNAYDALKGYAKPPSAPSTPTSSRFDGKDRYEVAVNVSEASYPDGTSNVILVNGSNIKLSDALTATPLAAALKAPILLVNLDTIPDATSKEITRLKPKNIYIIGGTGSVSQGIEYNLMKNYNIKNYNITRIAGANRYEVAKNVANKLKELLGKSSFDKAYVCNGYKYADALAVAPVAAKEGNPILFVSAGLDSDTKNTAAYINSLGIKNVDAIGGWGSISNDVVNTLKARRIDGLNRAALSTTIASTYYKNPDGVFIVNGYCPADALALGPYAVNYNFPILFIDNDGKTIDQAVYSYVKANKSDIKDVVAAGGNISVTDDALKAIVDE